MDAISAVFLYPVCRLIQSKIAQKAATIKKPAAKSNLIKPKSC